VALSGRRRDPQRLPTGKGPGKCTESSQGRLTSILSVRRVPRTARAYHQTVAGCLRKGAMAKRKVWVAAVCWACIIMASVGSGLRATPGKVNIEALLIATGRTRSGWLREAGLGRRWTMAKRGSPGRPLGRRASRRPCCGCPAVPGPLLGPQKVKGRALLGRQNPRQHSSFNASGPLDEPCVEPLKQGAMAGWGQGESSLPHVLRLCLPATLDVKVFI